MVQHPILNKAFGLILENTLGKQRTRERLLVVQGPHPTWRTLSDFYAAMSYLYTYIYTNAAVYIYKYSFIFIKDIAA